MWERTNFQTLADEVMVHYEFYFDAVTLNEATFKCDMIDVAVDVAVKIQQAGLMIVSDARMQRIPISLPGDFPVKFRLEMQARVVRLSDECP